MSLPGEDPLPLPLMSATNAQSKMAKDLSDWLNQDGPPQDQGRRPPGWDGRPRLQIGRGRQRRRVDSLPARGGGTEF